MTKPELMLKRVWQLFLWLLLLVDINVIIIQQVVERAYNDGRSAAYRSAIGYADKMIANNKSEMKRKDAEIKTLKERRCY